MTMGPDFIVALAPAVMPAPSHNNSRTRINIARIGERYRVARRHSFPVIEGRVLGDVGTAVENDQALAHQRTDCVADVRVDPKNTVQAGNMKDVPYP